MLLFFKAIIPGGASTDLSATPVLVAGYTSKNGTYVAPHVAVRHKRPDVPKPQPAPAPEASEPEAAAPPAVTSLADAVATIAGTDPFTAEQVAVAWPGHTVEDVLDQLHADTTAYAVMPDGEHWMRMADYLDRQDPADALNHVHAAASGDLPEHLRTRLEQQARDLIEASLRNARDGMDPSREPGTFAKAFALFG